MPSLLLIRHGQASYASADYDVLSERGVAQGKAVFESLEARGLCAARLVSGSLRRQRDTAAPWVAAGARLEVDPRWNEYDAADVLGAHSAAAASLENPVGSGGEALSSRDFQRLLDEALLAWVAAGTRSAAREPFPEFQERVGGALRDAMGGLRSGETGLVFTSGGVIGAVAASVLGLPQSALIAFNHVSINGSVTKLVGGRSGISLVSFNEHSHLEREPELITYR